MDVLNHRSRHAPVIVSITSNDMITTIVCCKTAVHDFFPVFASNAHWCSLIFIDSYRTLHTSKLKFLSWGVLTIGEH